MNKIKPLLLPLLIIALVGIGTTFIHDAVSEFRYRSGGFGVGCAILTLIYFLHRIWLKRTPC